MRCIILATAAALRAPLLRRRSAPALRVHQQDYDAVVIGSGVGGLCAGALLARYGRKVLLVEAHDAVGGCAHSFERGGFTLDSGPSLWAGCSAPSTSPLRQVLDATGIDVEWVTYDGWGVHDLKAGERFRMTVGPRAFDDVVREHGGEAGVAEWRALLDASTPVVDAAMACPPMALRADPLGFVVSALVPYLLPAIFKASLAAKRFVPDLLTGPSSLLAELAPPREKAGPSFVDKWVDYIAFALSGLPADGTVGAAVAYTLGDLHRPNAILDYPVGGSGAVCEALAAFVDGSPGCAVRTKTRVDEILVEGGRATGVRLADGSEVASDVVISNADAWTTATRLVKTSEPPAVAAWREGQGKLVPTRSFVHLWVGFDAEGVPEDLDCHHTVFNDGFLADDSVLDAEENMYIISIPTLFDPSMAPAGKHCAHVYAAATEPYEAWAGLDRAAYAAKKAEAAEPLWRALEAVVPDVRDRACLEVVGTPLTHARFNRRHKGTYGPAGRSEAGDLGGFGDGSTPVKGLWQVGDSQFPGIGVPAAAASGILVANALVGIDEHRKLLDDMGATLVAGKGWWQKPNAVRRAPGGRISADAGVDEVGCGGVS